LCGTAAAAWHAFFFVNKTLKFGVKFLVAESNQETLFQEIPYSDDATLMEKFVLSGNTVYLRS
jgi:hypothetical protein